MKYIITVEETIIRELEVELDTEIMNLTGAQRNALYDKTSVCDNIVYDNYDCDYELIE